MSKIASSSGYSAIKPVLWSIALVIHITLGLASTGSALAHGEFRDVMARRYKLKSISCKACHTSNKDKAVRNAFGKLLDQELKPKEITRRHKEAVEKGDEAKKKYEKEMEKHFLAALIAVEKKQLTFGALMEAGLLNGVRLDKEQVDVDGLTVKLTDQPDTEEPAAPENPEPATDPSAAKPPATEAAPTVEPKAEPTVEPKVEPVVEPKVEPVVEPKVEPVVEPKVEPVVEPKVEPVVEPKVEPVVEPKVEPSVEPKVAPQDPPKDSAPVIEGEIQNIPAKPTPPSEAPSVEGSIVPSEE